MAQGAQELVAAAAASQLGGRRTAGGDDHLVREAVALRGSQGKAAGTGGESGDLAPGAHLHAKLFQGQAQGVQDAVGLVGQGIYPSSRFCPAQQAQPPKVGQGVRHPEGLQGRAGKLRRLAMVVSEGAVQVAQVAAAVAGGQQLPAQPGLPFQQHHVAVHPLRRR